MTMPTKLLCIDNSDLKDRIWLPIKGQTYTLSMASNHNNGITVVEDRNNNYPIGKIYKCSNAPNGIIKVLADGRLPFRSSRFVDITGIEETAEASYVIKVGEEPDHV